MWSAFAKYLTRACDYLNAGSRQNAKTKNKIKIISENYKYNVFICL